jgi:hypothetical protein
MLYSAMEIETAARHCLPIVVVVINNNGIYAGSDALVPAVRDEKTGVVCHHSVINYNFVTYSWNVCMWWWYGIVGAFQDATNVINTINTI